MNEYHFPNAPRLKLPRKERRDYYLGLLIMMAFGFLVALGIWYSVK